MYDIAQLKSIPIASVLHFYKVPVFKRSETEMVCDCPLPSHIESSKEHKRTFSFGLDKSGAWKWFCHSTNCQRIGSHRGGDAIDLVCKMENLTAKDAMKRLQELFALGERREESNAAKPEPEATGNKPLAFALTKLDPDHDFIRSRGISLETAMDFGIGFQAVGSMKDRICFPLHEDGNLIGYAGRSVDGTEPKWKLPQGIIRSFLFGLERCDPTKPLVLVESCWAVLYLHQNHQQAAALLGSSMTEAQEKRLDEFAEIRVCMDNDEAGRDASEKIAARLRKNHKVSRAYLKE